MRLNILYIYHLRPSVKPNLDNIIYVGLLYNVIYNITIIEIWNQLNFKIYIIM